ncbi:hypothetical protein PsorP6_018852 [Peronosclerospora sorghi]|nr:hypothetical protein PsorP6_018810 [Peronosclerospora sorghi]KAI9895312.1 hypothetical protein PsorP6_018852 [Peronosclerospora sorghi]
MSIITVNLRRSAAAWHQYFEQQGTEVHYIEELKEVMTREFVPVGLQERLREKLDGLKQKHCRNLEEYIMKFRKLMSDIKAMSDLDRVMCFTRGLVLRAKQEVLYRRCQTTTEAMTVALEFERSHALVHEYRNNNNQKSRREYDQSARREYEQRTRSHSERSPTRVHNSRVYRDGDVIMDVGNSNISKEECARTKLCFYGKKPVHRLAECRSRKYNTQQKKKKTVQVSNTAINSESEDEEEGIIDTIVIGHVTAEEKSNELIRKEGSLGDARVKIIINSGADHNIIRPILGTHLF